MSGICLAAGTSAVRLALTAFTLAWTHTVEQLLWEEDWRVERAGLVLVESRVRGSGAGMEPGPEARLEGAAFRSTPALPPLPELVLARAPGLPDWRLCAPDGCRPLGALLPGSEGPVVLRPCPDP
jgi:hypothetical protein